MTLSTDKELKAFEQVVTAHESALRAFVAVLLDDPFEEHYLAQEVLLILWRKLEEIDLGRPLRPWLLSVAVNLVRQHRCKGRAVPIGGSDAVLEMLDDRLEKGEALDGPAFATLEHCLAKLDDSARQLVGLRYLDGLGIREIGGRVGNMHSAVTMKPHRLRALLSDWIRGWRTATARDRPKPDPHRRRPYRRPTPLPEHHRLPSI